MKRHVTCFVEKVGFEPRSLGTKAERCDHCATRPVVSGFKFSSYRVSIPATRAAGQGENVLRSNSEKSQSPRAPRPGTTASSDSPDSIRPMSS
jgi:hypothetical protein